METNLTKAHRIAFLAPDTGPVPGHHLVVFKKVGAGKVLRQVLAPGEVFKRKAFEKADSLLAYCVSQNRHLRHSFRRAFVHLEPQHSYILHFQLSFSIERPSLLVEQLDNDPLYRLESETAKLFGAAIRHLPWTVIVREDAHLESEALQRERADFSGVVRSNVESIQEFAATFGFSLADVSISRTLPESELRETTALTEVDQELVIREARHRLEIQRKRQEGELTHIDASLREGVLVRGAIAGSTADLIRRLSLEIRSVPELTDALPQLEEIVSRLRALPTRQAAIPVDREFAALAGAPATNLLTASTGGGPLAEFAVAAIALSDRPGATSQERRRLGAAILHMLAEVSLGEEASGSFLEDVAERIQRHSRAAFADLTDNEIELLRRLEDLQPRGRQAAVENVEKADV